MKDIGKRCVVYPIHFLGDHPEIDSLQIAEVGGNQVVVGRHYEEGVLGIFIPDGAIIPLKIAEEMRVAGKLAGKQRNRVKAREMFGILSEGLFYGSVFFDINEQGDRIVDTGPSWNTDWVEGQDVTEELGILFV